MTWLRTLACALTVTVLAACGQQPQARYTVQASRQKIEADAWAYSVLPVAAAPDTGMVPEGYIQVIRPGHIFIAIEFFRDSSAAGRQLSSLRRSHPGVVSTARGNAIIFVDPSTSAGVFDMNPVVDALGDDLR